MMNDALDDGARKLLSADIDGWLAELVGEYDHIVDVERATGDADDVPCWLVRMRGDDKDAITAWLTLGQRTLVYETAVLPAPEDNQADLYEQLLRRNARIVGARFSIGNDGGVYLNGELEATRVDYDALDWMLGTLYSLVEQCFVSLLRIGFAGRFSD